MSFPDTRRYITYLPRDDPRRRAFMTGTVDMKGYLTWLNRSQNPSPQRRHRDEQAVLEQRGVSDLARKVHRTQADVQAEKEVSGMRSDE
jgi:hypothetical protein